MKHICERNADCPLPPYELLKYESVPQSVRDAAQEEMQETQATIIDVFKSFRIDLEPECITRGPSITRYEFSAPRGLCMRRILKHDRDLMARTCSASVNILAPIPGKSTVGVELENSAKEPVHLRELLESAEFHNPALRIPVALGKNVYGAPVIGDLAAMPHVIVAGSTDSGKSVCINSMLLSMLYKFTPEELQLILVDPRQEEMAPYQKLPHLAMPVLSEPQHVIGALRWAVNEMERRYTYIAKAGVRNLADFNKRDLSAPLPQGDADEQSQPDGAANSAMPDKLPYIVIVINELADITAQVKEDLEVYISRLVAKARGAGIHMIVATETPRANVVTGIIKVNFPCRIALKVTCATESRVILDDRGAEKLMGSGDLFFLPPGGLLKMERAQGAFVSEAEVQSIVNFCAAHAKQSFVQSAVAEMNAEETTATGCCAVDEELYTRCMQLVITGRKASAILLQRRFSIGYGKAARIMEMLEARGVIAPATGSCRPREVLIAPQE